MLVRWLVEPKRLSRDQLRVLRSAIQRGEPLGVSAMTLLEMALLFGAGGTRLQVPVDELFATLDAGAGFHLIPLDVEVAAEVAAMGDALRDPADRMIASKLVPVVE